MKLSQLYSNDTNFKPIKFNLGFNIIIGKVIKENYKDTDTHNLGKTSLTKLLDFMLLKEIDKDHTFLKHFSIFEKHEFYLEVLLNDGIYLTIKRKVNNNTKISFYLSNKSEYLINNEQWDELDLPIRKAKKFLNSKLDFSIFKKGYTYQTFLPYFLKDENSFDTNFEKLFSNQKHETWKAPLLDLLSINSKFYKTKLKDEAKLDLLKKKYPDKESFSTQLIEKEAQKKLYEKKLYDLQQQIETCDYFNIDENITQESVNEVLQEISRLNTIKYNLSYDIKKLNESLEAESNTIDVEELQDLFDEVNLFFPIELKRTYDDLVNFNKQIFSERQESMKKTLIEKETKLKQVNKDLVILNDQQKKMVSILKQKNIYEKLLEQQKEVIFLETTIENISNNISTLKNTISIFSEMSKLTNDISTNIEKLRENIFTNASDFNKVLNTITQNIFKTRIGILNIVLNGNHNPDFKLSFMEAATLKMTSEGDGGTYGEWLCACFSLYLAIIYSKYDFYRFLFQDGIMETGDNRRKVDFIEEIKRICKEHNIQYITTAIEHEVNSPEVKKLLLPEDIVLELTDDPSGNGTLYGFSF
ncbi:MAG: DUF2326 domain-containing protein [Fusobacteriaceae bacterium]